MRAAREGEAGGAGPGAPNLRKGGSAPKGVLTLRFVSHAQPARLWKAVFLQIICSWFGNPPQKGFLGAGFLGAPLLSLKVGTPGDSASGQSLPSVPLYRTNPNQY